MGLLRSPLPLSLPRHRLSLYLVALTPRQNALRMSTKFNIRSVFYFRSSI